MIQVTQPFILFLNPSNDLHQRLNGNVVMHGWITFSNTKYPDRHISFEHILPCCLQLSKLAQRRYVSLYNWLDNVALMLLIDDLYCLPLTFSAFVINVLKVPAAQDNYKIMLLDGLCVRARPGINDFSVLLASCAKLWVVTQVCFLY